MNIQNTLRVVAFGLGIIAPQITLAQDVTKGKVEQVERCPDYINQTLNILGDEDIPAWATSLEGKELYVFVKSENCEKEGYLMQVSKTTAIKNALRFGKAQDSKNKTIYLSIVGSDYEKWEKLSIPNTFFKSRTLLNSN